MRGKGRGGCLYSKKAKKKTKALSRGAPKTKKSCGGWEIARELILRNEKEAPKKVPGEKKRTTIGLRKNARRVSLNQFKSESDTNRKRGGKNGQGKIRCRDEVGAEKGRG